MFESLGLVAVVLAIILILGAIVAGVLLIRGRSRSGAMADGMRIGVLESIAVDARRRLVLVRRDDVEHLVMIGGPSEFVVESNIGRSGARPLADSEASAAGQRAIKEAADRHGALPEPVAAAPAKFTFDETELLQGLDLSADASNPPAAPDVPRRREPAPIVTQTHSPAQTPPGAANDQRGFGNSGMRVRPASASSEGARETAQPETPEWKRRTDGTSARLASGDTNGTGAIRRMSPIRPANEERVRPSEERARSSSEERARPEPRRIPSTQETSPSTEQDSKRNRIPQRPEMPTTRQLPSVTAVAQPANGPSTDEMDIENEIVRALGMDTAPEVSEPAPAAQPSTAKPAAGGEPRTRLGDLADRLEEALAREVRSAGHAKTRLDVDLDSFGFDRERGRNAANGDRPQPAETSASGDNATSRSAEPAQRDKPAAGEPADVARRESRVRPEQRQAEQRQDNPPVISLSARRRETSDPLEDEMARLLGELTDGGRR